MNANNVFQNMFSDFQEGESIGIPELESREDQAKLVQELQTLVEGESHESEEYYDLLSDLFDYDYCMSDAFKASFMDEIRNLIAFEKEWRGSEES